MSEVESADIPWSEAVVLVCTKCSRKLVGDERLAEEMKKTLKTSFKENGYGKSVRPVTSSCLDICPEGRVAIAVLRRHAEAQALTVNPRIDEKTLFTAVRNLTTPSPV